MKKLFTVLALIAGLASATGAVLAETRVALVIGNDAYAHLPKLNNAHKDAEGMAAKLHPGPVWRAAPVFLCPETLKRHVEVHDGTLRNQ